MSQPSRSSTHPPKSSPPPKNNTRTSLPPKNSTNPHLSLNGTHPLLNRTHPPLNHTYPPHPSSLNSTPSDAIIAVWWSASILVLVILVAITIILSVLYFKKSCKFPSNKSGRIFLALFVFCLLFWVSEAALTLTTIIRASNDSFSGNTSMQGDWLGILPKIFYNIARLVMLFYFIIKSYVVFRDSAYQVSKIFIWILFILSVIAFTLQVAPLIYGRVKGERTIYTIYFLCAGWGIDFVVSIAAMYKFVAILFTLSLTGIEHSDNRTEIRLNNAQQKMMQTITRTTVLSILAVLSSVVFGFFLNPYPLINPRVTGNHFNVAAVCDSALNAICMYLSYGFTTQHYGFCCKFCDIAIGKLCIWCTRKAIERKSSKSSALTFSPTIDASRTNATARQDQSQLAVPSTTSKGHHGADQSHSGMSVTESVELTQRE
eukprot:100914_1